MKPMSAALVAVLSTVLMCVLLSSSANALTCPDCTPTYKATACEVLAECPHGHTTDMCGCCPACHKGENDECGGIWGHAGFCAAELECQPNAVHDQAPGRCIRKAVATP